MAREVDPTKSGYINFDPDGMSKINWIPTGGQVSEYRRDYRSETCSDPSKNTTVS